jgi:small subunit ribosomal protein S13
MAEDKDKEQKPEAPAEDKKAPATKRKEKKEEEKEERKAPTIKKLEGVKEDFRYIVRLANTDLQGSRSVVYALTGIKGMGVRMAEVVADLAQVPRGERLGNLAEDQVERIRTTLSVVPEQVPHWMVNRPHDFDTGNDLHMFGADVDILRRDDVNRMKMIRSYKGIRHEQGQKVRGQRTRSNGRSGLTVGVTKKAVAAAAAAAKAEEKGGKKEEKKEEKKPAEKKE